MTVPAIIPDHFPYFPYEGFTFSLGRSDGTTAWLSGHSGAVWSEDRGKLAISGGMGEQAAVMYEKIGAILAGADLGFDDVVHVVENVAQAGLDSYPEAEQVRRSVLSGAQPALTTVIVDRLVRRAALIEVQVTAQRGGGTPVTVGSTTRFRSATVSEAGGVIELPTILPIDDAGEVVAEDDFRGQYTYCLERAATMLDAVGLSLANAVRTVDYSTPATREVYSKMHRPRMEMLGPVYPGAAGILMSRMHRPGVLVSLDLTASREPGEVVNPGWSRYDTLSYSPGVRVGDKLFMSGFGSLDMVSQAALHPGDLLRQAEVTYSAILELVTYAGGTAADLVDTLEYVTPEGLPDYRVVADVRKRLLSAPWPASVGAVCGGLLRPEFLLEVVPFAVVGR
jgi:enamine deaminase RidA (YjgF/YER057c/UK114 family)